MDTAVEIRPSAAVETAATPKQRYYRRFGPAERVMHACLMLSFVGCALTGLPLLFADEPWAVLFATTLGGFHAAGLVHRFCAIVMLTVFTTHVFTLLRRAA